MTTRVRYAIQYLPKPGSGKEPLYLTTYLGQGKLDCDVILLCREKESVAIIMTSPAYVLEPRYPDYLPARVVLVRETITREIVE